MCNDFEQFDNNDDDDDDFEGELWGGGPPGCCVDVHENLASAQHRQTIRLTSTCIIITATITSSHHYNHYHIDISINITYISHIYHKGGRYLSFLIE